MLQVVSPEDWRKHRMELLYKEKELVRLKDALSEQRRQLPVTKVAKNYVFDGLDGAVDFAELFGPHDQLITYHFMFSPDWDEGCPHCSHCADNFQGAVIHLAARNTAFTAISRAPVSKIYKFRKQMGWTFPWHSSFGSDFNYDFQVTLDRARGAVTHNYQAMLDFEGENSGVSCFYRSDGEIYHTYSTYARGLDSLLNTYNYLDLTILGRQEDKSPDGYPQAWVRHKHKY
jgi:predicted dithiol-disulfide oxidoreductase (DUF899 family)